MPAGTDRGGTAAERPRRVHLAFEDPKAFGAQYARNLSRGGAMLASDAEFEPREIVDVVLEAPFAGAKLVLPAEVVHAGGGSVAVQFLDPMPELRARLEPLREKAERVAAEAPPSAPAEDDPLAGMDDDDFASAWDAESFDLDADAAPEGFETHAQAAASDPNDRTYRARADRAPARLAARVRGPTGKSLPARTRDLSATGMLLTVEGEELPVGRDVQVSIVHPNTGAQLTVPAKVVRHLEADGVVGAVAVELRADALAPEVQRFMSEVQEAEAQQRSAGIRGPLEELGGPSLLQMFAALSKHGTLTISHGVEEGVVVFENAMLRTAQVGAVSGTKALARMLAWREGVFEFRSRVDGDCSGEALMPMEAAILEALRILDEEQRASGPTLPASAKLRVERRMLAASGPPLGKTEQAVLELATAGFTVRRILDVIPENDAVIRSAIQALLDRGLVVFE